MSVITLRSLLCDGCENEETDHAAPTASEVRRHARKAGWTRPLLPSGYRIDLCPTCSAAREVEAREAEDVSEPEPSPAEERIVDLMAALDQSVNAAKAERDRVRAGRANEEPTDA